MNTYSLNENVIDFFGVKPEEAIELATDTANKMLPEGTKIVDETKSVVMQHSLIVGGVGALLLYAITSKVMYAAIGLAAGYLLNNALDKTSQTTIKTPFGEATI